MAEINHDQNTDDLRMALRIALRKSGIDPDHALPLAEHLSRSGALMPRAIQALLLGAIGP